MLVPVSGLRQGVMDVRVDGTLDLAHVREVAEVGMPTKLPAITKDGVVFGQRHGVLVQQRLSGQEGKLATHIYVDVYTNIVFDKLSPSEVADLRMASMEFDKHAPVRYLNQDDLYFNVKELVKAGIPNETIVKRFQTWPQLSKTRLNKILESVGQSILQTNLSAASAHCAKLIEQHRPIDVTKIGPMFHLPEKHWKKLLHPIHTNTQPSKKTFKSTLAKQPFLKKAGKDLKRVLDRTANDVRNSIMSKESAIKLVNAHIARAQDILQSAEEGLNRITSI